MPKEKPRTKVGEEDEEDPLVGHQVLDEDDELVLDGQRQR